MSMYSAYDNHRFLGLVNLRFDCGLSAMIIEKHADMLLESCLPCNCDYHSEFNIITADNLTKLSKLFLVNVCSNIFTRRANKDCYLGNFLTVSEKFPLFTGWTGVFNNYQIASKPINRKEKDSLPENVKYIKIIERDNRLTGYVISSGAKIFCFARKLKK